MHRTWEIKNNVMSEACSPIAMAILDRVLEIRFDEQVSILLGLFESYDYFDQHRGAFRIDLSQLIEMRAFNEKFELKVTRRNGEAFAVRYRDDDDHVIEQLYKGNRIIDYKSLLTYQYFKYNDNGDIYIDDVRFVKVVE